MYFGDQERAAKTVALLDKSLMIRGYINDLRKYSNDIKQEGVRLFTSGPLERIACDENARIRVIQFYKDNVEQTYIGLHQTYRKL